jgi:hypothetical protein
MYLVSRPRESPLYVGALWTILGSKLTHYKGPFGWFCMATRDLMDLTVDEVLLSTYLLVPLSNGSTLKKQVIDLEVSKLGEGRRNKWDLRKMASLMHGAMHL